NSIARIIGERNELSLKILEPAGAKFAADLLTEDCRANQRAQTLTRLAAYLPTGSQRFVLQITVQPVGTLTH
ncbi:MAG TPA: hypothetical protein VKP08_02790, partial [Anaerolineales bacterium]|nr:hypothetical protein [Anaerolineales bacterium]